jgi:hypothetical protein
MLEAVDVHSSAICAFFTQPTADFSNANSPQPISYVAGVSWIAGRRVQSTARVVPPTAPALSPSARTAEKIRH